MFLRIAACSTDCRAGRVPRRARGWETFKGRRRYRPRRGPDRSLTGSERRCGLAWRNLSVRNLVPVLCDRGARAACIYCLLLEERERDRRVKQKRGRGKEEEKQGVVSLGLRATPPAVLPGLLPKVSIRRARFVLPAVGAVVARNPLLRRAGLSSSRAPSALAFLARDEPRPCGRIWPQVFLLRFSAGSSFSIAWRISGAYLEDSVAAWGSLFFYS